MHTPLLLKLLQEKIFKEEQVQAVSFHATGEKVPWMFDFKSVALSQEFLKEFSRLFWQAFKEHETTSLQIGGMESGAIPLITGLSVLSSSPKMVNPFYIRKSRKKGDLANMVEGDINKDYPIILVDDILNNGITMQKQITVLEEQGYKVHAIFVCLRFRELSAYKKITDKGIRIESIFELDDLSAVLPVKNLVSAQQKIVEQSYKVDYKVTLTDRPNLYLVLPKSGPVLSGEFIFMGADDGTFYCLSKRSGDVFWSYTVPFGAGGKRIFSTCAVWKEYVMFGAYDGNFYCLNTKTGKPVWVFMEADWVGSSPCVDEDRGVVFIGLEFGLFKKHGGVVTIDIKTGKAIWKNYSMEGLAHATPAYSKKYNVVVCGCNDNTVYAFDGSSGAIRWKFKSEGEIKYGAVFDEGRGLVCVGSMDGGLYALSANDGSLYHRFNASAGFYSTPTLSDGRVYIGSLDKRVYCFDIEEKNICWTFETRGRIFASPKEDESSIYIGSNDGVLYELDKHKGEVRATIQLTERIVNRIEIEKEDGKKVLYIGTHLCELYRIERWGFSLNDGIIQS